MDTPNSLQNMEVIRGNSYSWRTVTTYSENPERIILSHKFSMEIIQEPRLI